MLIQGRLKSSRANRHQEHPTSDRAQYAGRVDCQNWGCHLSDSSANLWVWLPRSPRDTARISGVPRKSLRRDPTSMSQFARVEITVMVLKSRASTSYLGRILA